jgi:hypothetical protein
MAQAEDAGAPQPPRVDTIAVGEDQLIAVVTDEQEVILPIRSVCGALGLDARAQGERLREHDVLAQGLRVVKVPLGGRVQSVLGISRRFLAFWLATIAPAQVRAEARPKLVLYQTSLVDLLDSLYGQGSLALDPADPAALATLSQRLAAAVAELRATRSALLAAQRATEARVEAQDERLSAVESLLDERMTTVQGQLDEAQQRLLDIVKITAAQAAVIRLAIERLGKRYEARTGAAIYNRLHARFCAELGTPRYDALPAKKYADALAWLRARAAEYLPDDPEALPPLQEQLL